MNITLSGFWGSAEVLCLREVDTGPRHEYDAIRYAGPSRAHQFQSESPGFFHPTAEIRLHGLFQRCLLKSARAGRFPFIFKSASACGFPDSVPRVAELSRACRYTRIRRVAGVFFCLIQIFLYTLWYKRYKSRRAFAAVGFFPYHTTATREGQMGQAPPPFVPLVAVVSHSVPLVMGHGGSASAAHTARSAAASALPSSPASVAGSY